MSLASSRRTFNEDRDQPTPHECQRPERGDSAAARRYAVDPERCGTAAAQKFRGEDPSRLERQKLQGATTQCWLAQQIAEKVARRDEEKDEDARYAAYEAFVAESRGDLEGEEEAARFELRRALAAANARDAEERADAKVAGIEASRALERQEISARLVDPELIETTSVARSALGAHRYRPDHFKGLSTEQVKAILAENETIAADNMASKNAERRFDDEHRRPRGRPPRARPVVASVRRERERERGRRYERPTLQDHLEYRRSSSRREAS